MHIISSLQIGMKHYNGIKCPVAEFVACFCDTKFKAHELGIFSDYAYAVR